MLPYNAKVSKGARARKISNGDSGFQLKATTK
jgi:hypothetical protein